MGQQLSLVGFEKNRPLIGESSEIKRVEEMIRKFAQSLANVMITGESGTGKELVANGIHQRSARSPKPFIAINCAAVPHELLESELFGHTRGAFTGATVNRRGLFEEANGGTILLDEIGDLPLQLQAKILRLIQTKQVRAVGQNTLKDVDVRIISASHRSIPKMIKDGEFREDLFYRLNVLPLNLAPLRERQRDIALLAKYFLTRFTVQTGESRMRSLSDAAVAKLLGHSWPGNVRELENIIERATVLCEKTEIDADDIVLDPTPTMPDHSAQAELSLLDAQRDLDPVQRTTAALFEAGFSLRDIEREYITYVLGRTENRKEAATRVLGIDRKTLYRKEKLYGIGEILN